MPGSPEDAGIAASMPTWPDIFETVRVASLSGCRRFSAAASAGEREILHRRLGVRDQREHGEGGRRCRLID